MTAQKGVVVYAARFAVVRSLERRLWPINACDRGVWMVTRPSSLDWASQVSSPVSERIGSRATRSKEPVGGPSKDPTRTSWVNGMAGSNPGVNQGDSE